jgi:hypothetical protein
MEETKMKKILIITISLILLAAGMSVSQEYKRYARPQAEESFMKISFRDHHTYMTFFAPESTETISFERANINKTESEILIHGQPALNKDGFWVNGKMLSPSVIDRVEVDSYTTDEISLNFLQRKDSTGTIMRTRRQNEFSIIDDISIYENQFIRGSVIAFWSDIHIDGEVNENVIAVYGNITVGDNAVIRGDVVSINGSIDVTKKATIYGSIRSTDMRDKGRKNRWMRWYRRDQYFSPVIKLYYNRVDGLAPYLGAQFHDEDSLLPSVEVYGGYGFESARWRYHIRVEQIINRRLPVTLGGSLYRKLGSNDDWIISETENTIFAFIATEDYKDYFEAEGGYAFGRIRPVSNLGIEIGILSEKYRWLDGHRHMWSLLGGSKLFPANFSTIEKSYRTIGINEINNQDITSVIIEAKLDGPKKDTSDLKYSYWRSNARIERSLDGCDEDFTQYRATLIRRQSFSRESALIIKGVYGGSDGHLPLQRKFFIGGLGTLYGYDYKEYYGSEFWLGALDYGFEFPKTDMTGWIFYNIGQITDKPGRLDSAEYKHSLGIGLSFGDDIRVNVSKRLDRSGASPVINVRMEHLF